MPYVPLATVEQFKSNVNLGVFLRVLLPGDGLHVSFSMNDIPIAMPDEDPSTVYQGAGLLSGIPDLEILLNGKASTITFSLSGVDPGLVAEMLDQAPPVLGAPVTVGIAPMDSYWQPLSGIIPMWSGTADFISDNIAPRTDPLSNQTQVISLSVMSGDQSRQIGSNTYYSDLYQKSRFPTDNFFSRMPRYYQSYQVTWPSF